MLTKQSGNMVWRIYHMVHPYFFAHHHFHRRKIEALREAGISASILAVVPESLYQEHRTRYEDILAAGFTKILHVPDISKTNRAVLLFLLKEALLNKGVLIHVLRTDPSPAIRLRQWPIIGRKLRYVLEYEGDMPFEFVYQSAYLENPRPPIEPPPELRLAYEHLLHIQEYHAQKADGLVLMSQEQIKLWEKRLQRPLRACWLPTLSESKKVYFDEQKRLEIRALMGISDRIAFIYTGNVICKWQRLDAMCKFVAQLAKRIPRLWFIMLVRMDDLELAMEAIVRYGLDNQSTVLNVTSNEILNYLSAADVALFLRHVHPMNQVVTSGKLGEYLAAGLPIITTGANTEILNGFIRDMQAGVFLHDSLPVDEHLIKELNDLLERSNKTGWRAELSQNTAKRFGGSNDPFHAYVPFIREVLSESA